MRVTTLLLLIATAAAFVFGIEWLYVALGLILLVLLLAEASAPRIPDEAPAPPVGGPSPDQRAQASAYSAGQSFVLGLMRGEISHAVGRASSEELNAEMSRTIGGVSKKLSKKIDKLEAKIDKLEADGKKPRFRRHLDDD
ncbi:Uncharacterised protein [Candidatus Norongarragalina meridionalis]|nr:Uncharacterised protein [Candidatus Norongarragalina meridionalis]